jgi:hypothetical protein
MTVTGKTGRHKRHWEHFNWTVRYQVAGEEIADIAGSVDIEVRTVNQAVTGLLEEIGLTRREPAQIGRRKGGNPFRT